MRLAEADEESISNKLLKRLETLKKEKEQLAIEVEREEELLTNSLQKKLFQLRQDKVDLENRLEQEQEYIVNSLQKRISRAEHEKADLERQLEEGGANLLEKLKEVVERLQAEEAEERRRRGSTGGGDSSLLARLAVEIDRLGQQEGVATVASFRGGGGGGAGGGAASGGILGAAAAAEPLGGGSDGGSPTRRSRAVTEGSAGGEALNMGTLLEQLQSLKNENFLLSQKISREQEKSKEMAKQKADLAQTVEQDSERAFNLSASSLTGGSPSSRRPSAEDMDSILKQPLQSPDLRPMAAAAAAAARGNAAAGGALSLGGAMVPPMESLAGVETSPILSPMASRSGGLGSGSGKEVSPLSRERSQRSSLRGESGSHHRRTMSR